jgi:hypothetical protein
MNIERPKSNVELMYSVYFKKDFATLGASACAARAIPSFIIRHSIFCGSLFNPGDRSDQSNRIKNLTNAILFF